MLPEPAITSPADLDSVPDRPAVFLLWASTGNPYLARTALLRRRLRRLLNERERVSRVLSLAGVVERVEYWLSGSHLESALVHLELAQRHFPGDWERMVRLRPPAFLKLTLDNPFPRTMITTRAGRGLAFGPFATRAAAENYQNELLDLFQIRRCEENLAPSPDHPGCIYGEMNRCIRPCQEAVTREEYASEAARVAAFLRTGGASLFETAVVARERASAEMQFEEAERWHDRVTRIGQVRTLAGELAREIEQLAGVAIVRSSEPESIELLFLLGGRFLEPRRLSVKQDLAAGQSMDHRLREIARSIQPEGKPSPEHLAVLTRWHGSSWRDGEWISFESLEKIPYRKLVNAIGRVAGERAA